MSKGIALITGASRGIGRGIALKLAENGYTIAGTTTTIDPDNTESGILEVQARVEALGQKLLPIEGDVSVPADREHMLQAALDEFGRVDLLVNNAGITSPGRVDILEATPENFRRVMEVNLEGPFFLTQIVAKQMIGQPVAEESCSPAIIFITSVSATTASPNRGDYSVSKAGLSMTAQTYAVRLAQHGINVYEIQPGIVKTDMTKAVIPQYEEMIKGDKLLNKRWGTPEDIGKAVLALADGCFDYATGAIIEVGGGFGVRRL
jgi:NAD(P)-dependent dehydrogenase (short-subunit alcohol dehydrogenase family)